MTRSTTGILLAAGAGTRLRRGPKALLAFRGRTLVEVLADVLRSGGCREVVVVLGADADRVRAETNLRGHRVIDNRDWASGMGGSFRAGVAAAGGTDVLVALVDQPGLTPEIVEKLLATHQPGRVTAAAYAGADGVMRRAHPVLFDAALAVEAAESASGDAGARQFLQAHPELVDVVDCTVMAGKLGGADVDTSEQLHLLD